MVSACICAHVQSHRLDLALTNHSIAISSTPDEILEKNIIWFISGLDSKALRALSWISWVSKRPCYVVGSGIALLLTHQERPCAKLQSWWGYTACMLVVVNQSYIFMCNIYSYMLVEIECNWEVLIPNFFSNIWRFWCQELGHTLKAYLHSEVAGTMSSLRNIRLKNSLGN